MSNENKWNKRYESLKKDNPEIYGSEESYALASKFLSDCSNIEDRACGSGGFMKYRPDAIGIDGSITPFAKVKADLQEYVSDVEAIHLRHCLEHDHHWEQILENCIVSAYYKICITFFVVPTDEPTRVIAQGNAVGVDDSIPTIHINRQEFLNVLYSFPKIRLIETKVIPGSCYGQEELWFITMVNTGTCGGKK